MLGRWLKYSYIKSGRRPTFFREWDECRTLSGYALDVYPFADDKGCQR